MFKQKLEKIDFKMLSEHNLLRVYQNYQQGKPEAELFDGKTND